MSSIPVMVGLLDGLTLELAPHGASVSPEDWTGDHGERPLSQQGREQAEALVSALGVGVDGIYSSPALRCRQTVEPLAKAAALSIVELEELVDAGGFVEPRQWTHGIYEPVASAIGGAWSAGRALRALATIAARHADGRVVAANALFSPRRG